MIRALTRGGVCLFLLLCAAGYAVLPATSSPAYGTGMVLGHVPQASAPTSASIVIGKNAMEHGYKTKRVVISQGGSLSVVNLDAVQHTVTSVARGKSGSPLFNVYADAGKTTSIPAASRLAAGTYEFYCQFHPNMRGTLVVEGGSGGTKPVPPKFEQRLKLPPVVTGAHPHIPIKRADVRILPHGPKTSMWTYGGTYPGPTIRRPAGARTAVTFTNHLPRADGSVTVHFHGDHHSSANDGQPTTHLIGHGKSRTYVYPLTDAGKPERAAFDFYHDHRMAVTSRNNWEGLQGMVITTDRKSAELKLPTGRYDVPLDVADRSFGADNALTDPFPKSSMSMPMTGPSAPPGDSTVGSTILVDGRFAPYLNVATHKYRLRLLNSSNFTTYDFALSDGRPLVQIGTGNGLLPKPVIRQDILLGPAQRADVVIDFHGELHKRVQLESVPRTSGSPKGIGSPSASLMQFRVDRSVSDASRIPTRLQAAPPLKAPKQVSATWTFGLGGDQSTGSYWTINGKPFDPHRVDLVVPLGATQTWRLRNVSSITHFIHLHEEQWHTVSRDGKRPPAWERGLEDVWRLDPGENVKVAAKFTDYTGVFMLHCHMLDHEDHGMMAQFAVEKRGSHAALPAGYYDGRAVTSAGRGTAANTMSMAMPGAMLPLPAATAARRDWSIGRLMSRGGSVLALEIVAVFCVIATRRAPSTRQTLRRS